MITFFVRVNIRRPKREPLRRIEETISERRDVGKRSSRMQYSSITKIAAMHRRARKFPSIVIEATVIE